MTLSSSLNNAFSGLQATQRQTDLISNNVSNALTENYSRRTAELAAANVGGEGVGVRVVGVSRATSPVATAARRVAEAEAGAAGALADARKRLADAIGDPGDENGLAGRADALNAAIATAADTPESAAFLSQAVDASRNYASSITRIATEAMRLRTEADASIANQVATINSTLTKLQSLNVEIKGRAVAGRDTSALEDESARLIKQISSIIPVKTVQREFNTVALFTENGGQLLDGKAAVFEFDATSVVTPSQTLANGALSGLTVNGRATKIGEGAGAGLFDGGSLAAAFEIRDVSVPEFTDALDGMAADLITRVQGLAEDPTLGAADPGLFTDAGIAYDPANLTGISSRIAVNAAVDPDQGGEVFRLRDGLGAATAGLAGDDTVLRGLQDALGALNAAPTASILTGTRDAAGFAAELSAFALSESASADESQAFQLGRLETLRDEELGDVGVDTDEELANLLVVEQAFAANARVIQVVDDLLEQLTQL